MITVLYDRAQSPIFDIDVVTRTTEQLSPIYVHTSDQSENEDESSDMSYDRVDIPDSPMSIDSIKSPQFNIETPKYIEYVGGVRIVDYDQLGKYRKLKGYDMNQPEPEPRVFIECTIVDAGSIRIGCLIYHHRTCRLTTAISACYSRIYR